VAEKLGEPYGTLVLTFSVIVIEVSLMAAIMLRGQSNPTLARDAMIAALMIVLNGMVGTPLLMGGAPLLGAGIQSRRRARLQQSRARGSFRFRDLLLIAAQFKIRLNGGISNDPQQQ
jgi:hypothetical protein